jgi:chemotaxis protein CheC
MANAAALSPELRDVLTEAFNIGIGKAAQSLSIMVEEEILLSVPHFELLPAQDVFEQLSSQLRGAVCAVKERFGGDLSGEAWLLFPEKQSLELVRSMIQSQTDLDLVSTLEQEALIEVGNILLNACLAGIANLLKLTLECAVPNFTSGALIKLFPEFHKDNPEANILLLHISFRLAERSITGMVGILLGLTSLDRLVDAAAQLWQQYHPLPNTAERPHPSSSLTPPLPSPSEC